MAEKTFLETVNGIILWGKNNVEGFEENELSDGYHTFNELYEFRKMYNAALFNEWGQIDGFDYQANDPTECRKYSVHKSWKHHDGRNLFSQIKTSLVYCFRNVTTWLNFKSLQRKRLGFIQSSRS